MSCSGSHSGDHGHLIELATKLACRRMKGDALNEIVELLAPASPNAAKDDRHGFLEIRAELERLICECTFSPRPAHLVEVVAYPIVRYRAFHVPVPG
jgi:DNA-binding GntR family transcriptional regulator